MPPTLAESLRNVAERLAHSSPALPVDVAVLLEGFGLTLRVTAGMAKALEEVKKGAAFAVLPTDAQNAAELALAAYKLSGLEQFIPQTR